MAREKTDSKGQYGDVVARLGEIVQALEAGDLSLEDSLERFAEGVRLVKEGEALLASAEKRIEQLLSDDGRTQPLELPDPKSSAAGPSAPAPSKQGKSRAAAPTSPAPPDGFDDDVPF